MNKQLIIIMDFSTCEIHVYDFDPNIWEEGEDFVVGHYSEHGQTFKEGQCEWMIVDLEKTEGRLPIYIH